MKNTKHFLWSLLLLWLLSSQSFIYAVSQQQSKTVSGIVVDINDSPLTGVAVHILNTTQGVITDVDGKFDIKIPASNAGNAILAFSFLGYDRQEIKVSNQQKIKVTMHESDFALEEVVVVGYGSQKKVSVTGSVVSVQTKELKQSPSSNLVGTLAGRLPGLTTVQSSGQPGKEDFKIYLRGVSTTNGQEPLILIDGVPRDNLASIDPNEVASISVLKDASATAVFGVRGANGVILVTSKRGNSGKPEINITSEVGFQSYTRQIEALGSYEHALLRNQAIKNQDPTAKPQFSDAAIEKYRTGSDPFAYPSHDWFDEYLKDYAPQTRVNANITGGTERINYFINVGYVHQAGMFKTESKSDLGYDPQHKLDRYNFRTNLDIKIASWIKSSVDIAGYIDKVNAPGGQAGSRGNPMYIMASIFAIPPYMPGPLTVDGYGVRAGEVIAYQTSDNNPTYGILNRSGYIKDDNSKLNTSVAFDFDLGAITKGLSSKVMVSFDSQSLSRIDGNIGYDRYDYSFTEVLNPTTGQMEDKLNINVRGGNTNVYTMSMSKLNQFSYKMNLQWLINYNRTFAEKHQVTGMFLAQRDNNERIEGGSDLLLPYNVLGLAGRATYGYDNRYLAEVNVGYNGSEQFQKNKRFGLFPSGSIGWVVSNEEFMKNQKLITNLKLRASYGLVGNDRLGDTRFLYMDNINVGGGWTPSLGDGKTVNEVLLGNPDLTWEKAYKQNYGIDLGFLNDFRFTADVFYEKRKDILITRGTVPTIQGLPLGAVPKANMGQINNRGYELELSYTKAIGNDWLIMAKANYNYNKNKVISLDEAANDHTYAYPNRVEGFSVDQNWGYEIDWNSPGKGYFVSQEEIDNYVPYNGTAPKPGDFVYKNLNGDGIIDVKDQAPVKYSFVPRVSYAFSFSVSYKGLDVSALLQGVSQTSQYYSGWGIFETNGGPNGSNYYPQHRYAWTQERYESGEKILAPRLSPPSAPGSSLTANSYFIMDRSFLRLKNAEIGYMLPQIWTKKIGLEKVRFYVNGQNLFVWDKFPFKHFDPEQKDPTSVMPIIRLVNLGVNVTL